jgi:hypothetical protein
MTMLAIPLLTRQPVSKLNTCSNSPGDADIQIHGWDSTGWFGHDIMPESRETAVVVRRLNKAPASFQGIC